MIVNGHLTFVTMIILHTLRANSIAFIVSRTLLSLYGSADAGLLPQCPVQLND